MNSGNHLFEKVHAILEIFGDRLGEIFLGRGLLWEWGFDSCSMGDRKDFLEIVGQEESTREIFFKNGDSRLHRE